jgi:hypothetical protein
LASLKIVATDKHSSLLWSMEEHVFQLSFTIEGATEKVYKFIDEFKHEKLLKHVIYYNITITKCFCNFIKIKILTSLLFRSILFLVIFILFSALCMFSLELIKVCCHIIIDEDKK